MIRLIIVAVLYLGNATVLCSIDLRGFFGAESDVRLAEAALRGDRAAVRSLLQQGGGS